MHYYPWNVSKSNSKDSKALVNSFTQTMDELGNPVFMGSAPFKGSIEPCRIVASPEIRVYFDHYPQEEVTHRETEHRGPFTLLPFVEEKMEWIVLHGGEWPKGRKPILGGCTINGNKKYHGRLTLKDGRTVLRTLFSRGRAVRVGGLGDLNVCLALDETMELL
ncbi:hypothetical protein B0H16DRAFT_870361 [Mycena metata]|uniref:Uncharacterized protein n=1 Tax=Mycena metata TaxID=1033252 RepID=A0AAD7N7X2_9AGAR|nr:hypothetical protein B0H16DRAFT_870361 [Mycena metata]